MYNQKYSISKILTISFYSQLHKLQDIRSTQDLSDDMEKTIRNSYTSRCRGLLISKNIINISSLLVLLILIYCVHY